MEYINKITVKQKLKNYCKHPFSFIMCILVGLAAIITVLILLFLIGYILVKGIPNLSWKLFEWKSTTENASMLPAIINTLIMTVLSLLFAVPIGVGAAIYMVEYARRGNKLVKVVRTTAETLAGIPSIVYGLFGFLMFNVAFRWGYSMLGGALTLATMILPVIMRTTEEALIAVPDSYREGSFGLGAGRLRTVFKIVLPSAMSGILSGVILSIGRIVGETAALLYTSGTYENLPSSLMSSGRTLSVHMYSLLSEGLYMDEAYATAVVLLVFVFGINLLSSLLAKKLGNKA